MAVDRNNSSTALSQLKVRHHYVGNGNSLRREVSGRGLVASPVFLELKLSNYQCMLLSTRYIKFSRGSSNG